MRRLKVHTLSLLILLSASVVSAEAFSTKHLQGAVGFQAASLLHKRGIITYEGWQALPLISVQLFHPDWLIAGSALYYTNHFSQNWILRGRLNIDATGDSPLYETGEKEIDRVRRETTSELDIYLEYRTLGQSFVRLQYSQDLMAHKGYYAELYGRVALIDFLEQDNGRALLQPGFFAAVGGGNSTHNQYLYGAGADGLGLNNIEFGLSVTSPSVIDVFWPTLQISHFQILGDGNRHGAFVQEQSGWSAQLLAAFRVF
jgi:hypothetical protein